MASRSTRMTDGDPADELPGGVVPRDGPDPAAEAVVEHWPGLVADLADLADAYRERGWDVHEIHPGDVTVLAGEDATRHGFDVLAPDDEFDPVAAVVDDGATFPDATVYRRLEDGVCFLLVVLEDAAAETAVLVPAYYSPATEQAFVADLSERPTVELHLRPLDRRSLVTFQHDDPSLFLPNE